jgi:ubiquinone/menaquinone biosynthesis C-methylase UbiE
MASGWREFGFRYAAAETIALVGDRLLVRPAQHRLLRIEGERGVLGPAHREYVGHSVGENRDTWGTGYEWRSDAEDWTWSQEWKDAMVEELLRPTMSGAAVLLEIGPGGGRWSKHLIGLTDELILVDITDRTLALCQQRLGEDGNLRLIQNHGGDLPGVDDASVDRVWSFDVFVHIAPTDLASYLLEIARVLRPGGVAVIHHAGASRPLPHQLGWRSPMTAKLFANLATEAGLDVQRQLTTWPRSELPLAFGDVITVLLKS